MSSPLDADDHGRIGYGRYGRWTPIALAGVLIVSLLLIGLNQRRDEGGVERPGRLVGQPAPAFTLPLLEGGELRLSDFRGSVVLLNFWASWCEPCRDEAPALEALHRQGAVDGQPVAVIGIDLNNDNEGHARAFIADLGLTYPIGRDLATDQSLRGPIEQAYNVPNYPATVAISPDGTVGAVMIGEASADDFAAMVAEASRLTE